MRQYFRKQEYTNDICRHPSLLFKGLLQLLGCFWVSELESRNLRLSWMDTFYLNQIEQRRTRLSWPHTIPNPDGLAEKVQADIVALHSARVDIGPYQHLLKETQLQCKHWAEACSGFNEFVKDFDHLWDETERLQVRILKTIEFLQSISEEFKQERLIYRNIVLFYFALWAFVWSPITLTSSIMNLNQVGDSNKKVGDVRTFAIVVVPLGVLVISITYLGLTWQGKQEHEARRRSSQCIRATREGH